MKTEKRENKLYLFPEGRIDATNASAFEREASEALDAHPGAEVTVDADALEYISSAGLRVLMKLRKATGKPLTVENASPTVYEIFETTGFTELLDVHKGYRRVSVDGLPLIGEGATAKVYRLDSETVVKAFGSNVSFDLIRKENALSKSAFLLGIPTAISYDVVKVGEGFGVVYELLDAQSFLSELENDKANLEKRVGAFARAMRDMHRVEVPLEQFQPLKSASLASLPYLEGLVCSKEEVEKLRRLYESIPDRNTFVHGDCHPGNIMIQKGELMFIDLTNAGAGHPIFDMSSMCSIYYLRMRLPGAPKDFAALRNFTPEEAERIWKAYLRSCLETDDEAFLRKAEQQIAALTSARTLFAAVFIPGLLPPEYIAALKRTALEYVDGGLEEICF